MPNAEDPVPRTGYSSRAGITWQQILQRPSWISNLTGGGSSTDGSDVAMSIDTSSGRVRRLAAPIDGTDAANKAYVDAQVASANTGVADWDLITDKPVFTEKFTMVDDNTNVKLITNLDMNFARIRNMGAPVNPQEAANKQYVDSGIATVDSKIDDEVADCLRDAKAYADGIRTIAGTPDWTQVINKPSYLDDDGPFSMDSQRVLIVDTNMSLADNTLHDVADPSLPNDAANKAYVDDIMSQAAKPADVQSMITASSAQDRRWTNITEKPTWVGKMDYIVTPTTANPNGLDNNYIHVKTNVDMDGQLIAGLADPTHASHAVPLRYLNTKISELQEGAATGVLEHITRDSETAPTKIIVDLPIEFPATSRKRIRYVADPQDTTDAVTKGYVDTQIAAGGGSNPYADFLTVDGTELAIANVKAPTVPKDASTKKYVDDRFTNYQPSWSTVNSKPSFLNPLADGTYNHFRYLTPLSSFMTIKNLADPSSDQDAATKSYVDEEIERKATLSSQMSMDMNGRMLFKPNVEFTSPANGRMRFNATVVFDRAYGFSRTANNDYRSNSNIWINKVTVRASVFIEDSTGLTDFRLAETSDPLILQTFTSPTVLLSYIWSFEEVSSAPTYKTIEISDDYTNKTIIVKVTPIIEGYALPAGQFHNIPNGGLTAYRSAPAGVKFTYTLPHNEVPRFEQRVPVDVSNPTGLNSVYVNTTAPTSIRVRGLNLIVDDSDQPVQINLHYNTTDNVAGSTTIENVTVDSNGTYNISQLVEKTSYYIWVSAIDAAGNFVTYVPVVGAQPATTTGTPPTGLSGVAFSSATANSITLGGLGGITDASYPVRFTVKCRLTSVATDAVAAQAQATITAAGSTPTVTISGLSGDTRYYLWLEATDNLGTVANATLHTADIKTVNYDVWDFIVKQGAVSLFNIELDRVQWDGTQALTSSMFTYVRPGATTSNAGTPTVDLLLDSTIDTPLKWTPTAAPVGSTLFTIRTPIGATDPVWTLSWWKPRNRPGLEIKKNGERFWIDPTLNLTGEAPAPYPVWYPSTTSTYYTRGTTQQITNGIALRSVGIESKIIPNGFSTVTVNMTVVLSQGSEGTGFGIGIIPKNDPVVEKSTLGVGVWMPKRTASEFEFMQNGSGTAEVAPANTEIEINYRYVASERKAYFMGNVKGQPAGSLFNGTGNMTVDWGSNMVATFRQYFGNTEIKMFSLTMV